MTESKPSDRWTPFEQRLRHCSPAAPRLERARLMYLAGRASAERERTRAVWWYLPATAAGLVACVVLGYQLGQHPRTLADPADAPGAGGPGPSVAADHREPAADPVSPPSPRAARAARPWIARRPSEAAPYLRARAVAFSLGLDALGAAPAGYARAGAAESSAHPIRIPGDLSIP